MDTGRGRREGSNEIFFAVIATSITLAIVFLPIIFLEGFVGRLFREFGIVVAGAVLISAFVSLTLTPVLSVKLTSKNHGTILVLPKTGTVFQLAGQSYRSSLDSFMRKRGWALVMIVACLASYFRAGFAA